jgi:hypothetical protein
VGDWKSEMFKPVIMVDHSTETREFGGNDKKVATDLIETGHVGIDTKELELEYQFENPRNYNNFPTMPSRWDVRLQSHNGNRAGRPETFNSGKHANKMVSLENFTKGEYTEGVQLTQSEIFSMAGQGPHKVAPFGVTNNNLAGIKEEESSSDSSLDISREILSSDSNDFVQKNPLGYDRSIMNLDKKRIKALDEELGLSLVNTIQNIDVLRDSRVETHSDRSIRKRG